MKQAQFPSIKTIEEFDFGFQQSISKAQIQKLSDMIWIESDYNLLFLGPPGTGKSHLSIALVLKALKQGYIVSFVNFDELIKILKQSELARRYKIRLKQIMKSNKVIVDEIGFMPISHKKAIYSLILCHK